MHLLGLLLVIDSCRGKVRLLFGLQLIFILTHVLFAGLLIIPVEEFLLVRLPDVFDILVTNIFIKFPLIIHSWSLDELIAISKDIQIFL